jgi:hypothetical protein
VPQPSCPGCLRPASTDQHEHECDELGTSFITALTTWSRHRSGVPVDSGPLSEANKVGPQGERDV